MRKGEDIETGSAQRSELREFLQARRAALKPENLGFQSIGRRRAPGLRREEVASIAGVGLTWYTWLEQGRDISVSEDMLQRLARALNLSPHDTAYLFSLAGRHPPEVRTPSIKIDSGVQLALDGFQAGPGFVLNARMDTVASNRLADAVYRFDEFDGPLARNMVWRLFMDPRRRRLYVNWTDFALFGVGLLRGTYATHIGDPAFESLVHALRGGSSEFDAFWKDTRRRGTSSLAPSEVQLRVPGFGILKFVSVRLTLPTCPEHFMVLLPPVDSKAAAAMAKISASLQYLP
jgi:transcriptional regulator with XRE-family HTH domain